MPVEVPAAGPTSAPLQRPATPIPGLSDRPCPTIAEPGASSSPAMPLVAPIPPLTPLTTGVADRGPGVSTFPRHGGKNRKKIGLGLLRPPYSPARFRS